MPIICKKDGPTNIINYFFSRVKTIKGHSFSTKTRLILITMHGFAFFYITPSSFCHVFVTITAFVTFQSL